MRKIRTSLLAGILSALPAVTVLAQFEETDRQYAEKRSAQRERYNMIKLYIGGALLVIAGGAWVVLKVLERRKSGPNHGPDT
jgi:O-antigen ligase